MSIKRDGMLKVCTSLARKPDHTLDYALQAHLAVLFDAAKKPLESQTHWAEALGRSRTFTVRHVPTGVTLRVPSTSLRSIQIWLSKRKRKNPGYVAIEIGSVNILNFDNDGVPLSWKDLVNVRPELSYLSRDGRDLLFPIGELTIELMSWAAIPTLALPAARVTAYNPRGQGIRRMKSWPGVSSFIPAASGLTAPDQEVPCSDPLGIIASS